MAQLGDTVVTGSLAVSNCIYGSVTCATTATNACKGWNGSAFANFGSNAFNSTSFTTCTGTVTAITVSVNGVSATSTSGCATASITLTDVNACCAKQICRCGYSSAHEFDVALVNGCSSVSDAYIYASSSCRLKFCNCKGVLKITDSNGCLSGYMCALLLNSQYVTACCVLSNQLVTTCAIKSAHVLGTASSSADVSIRVYCGTCSSTCNTYFTFCGCDGRMHGNVQGVLNAVTPSSPSNGDIWIA